MIEKYSDDFQLCRTANDVEDAIRGGRIASLFGLEGYVSLICGVVRLMVVPIPLAIPLEVSHFSKTRECDKRGTDSSPTNVPHARRPIYDPNSWM